MQCQISGNACVCFPELKWLFETANPHWFADHLVLPWY